MELSKSDMAEFISTIIANTPTSAHTIQSGDAFYEHGIPSIITQAFSVAQRVPNKRANTEAERAISEYSVKITFDRAHITRPQIRDQARIASNAGVIGGAAHNVSADMLHSTTNVMTPALARSLMQTYSVDIFIDATVEVTTHRKTGASTTTSERIVNQRIGAIPCMVGCCYCHLRDLPYQQLIAMYENPRDTFGYMIIRGGEWSIDSVENTTSNDMRITTQAIANTSECARVQVWSRAGDHFENSFQVIIRQLTSGEVTVEIQYSTTIGAQIPLVIFLRMLGDITDKQIAEMIIGDLDAPGDTIAMLTAKFEAMMNAPFHNKEYQNIRYELNHKEIVGLVGAIILRTGANSQAERDENVVRDVHACTMDVVDKRILPHLGQLPADRPNKQRYVCYAVRKMFLASLGAIESLDRDSQRYKRVHAAGIILSKTFKAVFSRAITSRISKYIRAEFANTPFADISLKNIIASAIQHDDLETAMAKAITAGSDTRVAPTFGASTQRFQSRVSSQLRNVKNDMNAISIANNITVASAPANKQTERAEKVRSVHATQIGYIDVSQSADSGEKVGIIKQKTCTTIISGATSSAALAQAIVQNEVQHGFTRNVPARNIEREGWSYVFVNGNIIGFVQRAHEFVARWREHRREKGGLLIHKHTSIYHDPQLREVMFWTDYGRMLRPMVIVYNNLEEFDAACTKGLAPKFKQWTRLTKEIIAEFASATRSSALAGQEYLAKLVDDGVIEYIAADECENMFYAPNIDVLAEKKHDFCTRYTHCDIEQAIFGMLMLAAPLVNHAYTYRNTLYTCQRKSACSWNSLSFPYRTDKLVAFQYSCEQPLVHCMGDDHTLPNGVNCIVAIMMHTGYNQEDAIVLNESSVQRGLFNASMFGAEVSRREHNETFGMPRDAVARDRHKNSVAENLDERGVARKGTILERDHVVIAKYMVAMSGASQTPVVVDKSTLYKHRTKAYVEDVTHAIDERQVEFTRVKWRQPKPVIRGDKCSSRTGNKGIVAHMLPACDMPYSEDGIIPDIIVNAHSIPSRRALNQIIESVLGEYAASVGCRVDATSFMPVDVDAVIDALHSRGYTRAGYRQMYCGTTGDWIDTQICVGPTTYQRLQKFADNEYHAAGRSPTCALTHQPIRGRMDDGSFRVSEMEVWCLAAQGSMRVLDSKMRAESDGTFINICRNCGLRAEYNADARIYECRTCRADARIVRMPSCWTSNLVQHELRALGVQMRFGVAADNFYTQQPPH